MIILSLCVYYDLYGYDVFLCLLGTSEVHDSIKKFHLTWGRRTTGSQIIFLYYDVPSKVMDVCCSRWHRYRCDIIATRGQSYKHSTTDIYIVLLIKLPSEQVTSYYPITFSIRLTADWYGHISTEYQCRKRQLNNWAWSVIVGSCTVWSRLTI